MLLSFLVAATLAASGCDGLGGNPVPPAGPPTPEQSVFVAPTAPELTGPIGKPRIKPDTPEPIEHPLAFPPLEERAQVTEYVRIMADIHVGVTRNRQYHEKSPMITEVRGAVSCPTVPGQTGTLRQVGNMAKNTKAGPALIIAACFKGNRRSIFFAPDKLYQIRQTKNVHELEDLIRNAMRDYLAGTTQDKIGLYDRDIVACSAGRMIGGLIDGNYIGYSRGLSLEYKPNDQSERAKIYRTARDTGSCPPRLLGSNG